MAMEGVIFYNFMNIYENRFYEASLEELLKI